MRCTMTRQSILFPIPASLLLVDAAASAELPELEVVRALMQDSFKVRIEHTEQTTPAAENKPSLKRDLWSFQCGLVTRTIGYARYLNQPPDFTGSFPSLANSDMGIGFDPGAWGGWYRGNTLRVMLNGRDVFAAQPASQTEMREGTEGRLRFVWELPEKGRLALSFVVPAEGEPVFAQIHLAPGGMKVESLEVRLTGYPGGFGPTYGLPSHRWVKTAHDEGGVPKDFASKEFPKVALHKDDAWVFYADQETNKESLGLVLLPGKLSVGAIALSNYGVGTAMSYPRDHREIRLAFHAYDVPNESAQRMLLESVEDDLKSLTELVFWGGK